ncbi:YdjY domain-containing protein [Clostridium carboxidivorans]|nr:YdjY domain-containing protein [Clostridium carboxidivorans]
MKKIISIAASILLLGMVLAGCSNKQQQSQESKPSTKEETMTVNKDKKEVKMQAEVNGKYFTEGTRHAVVYKGGKNGEKSILRGLADEKKFYEAMMSLGAKPGNNLTAEDMKKGAKSIEGSKVNVFVTWDGLGKEIPFGDVIKSTDYKGNDLPLRAMDFRFGGNIDRANKNNTGCVLCLDSCATGIVSNASYKAGEVEALKNVKFYGKKDVLPKDGTKVTVIFRLAE